MNWNILYILAARVFGKEIESPFVGAIALACALLLIAAVIFFVFSQRCADKSKMMSEESFEDVIFWGFLPWKYLNATGKKLRVLGYVGILVGFLGCVLIYFVES